MLPQFLIIGAPRCGTTSICDTLAACPDVFISAPKEPEFFNTDSYFKKGMNWYESLFSAAESNQIPGEGTAHYGCPTVYPGLVDRIFRHLPDCRLVYAVRHPIRRIESHWKLLRASDTVPSLDDLVERHLPNPLQSNLIAASFYYRQSDEFLKVFAPDQLLVVFLEDWQANPKEQLGRILDHIGASRNSLEFVSPARSHASSEWVRDGRLLSLIRHMPGFSLLKKCLPKEFRIIARSVTSVRALDSHSNSATLSGEVYERLADLLSEDVKQFLARFGKPEDFWKLK